MLPVQSILSETIIDIVRRQPTTQEKVEFAWRTTVGPAVARASSVSLESDGTLVIVASDERWQREIQRSMPAVRPRLTTLLGDAIVRVTFASFRR